MNDTTKFPEVVYAFGQGQIEVYQRTDYKRVCNLPLPDVRDGKSTDPQRYEQQEKNAKLITEAFKVAAETNLTPKQMNHQFASLLHALEIAHKELLGFVKTFGHEEEWLETPDAMDIIENAIQEANTKLLAAG